MFWSCSPFSVMFFQNLGTTVDQEERWIPNPAQIPTRIAAAAQFCSESWTQIWQFCSTAGKQTLGKRGGFSSFHLRMDEVSHEQVG
jgi:hypothetical protein